MPADKPAKPYPDFPLYAHAVGQWAKKIRGKLYYFGPWRDPQAALDKYLDERDDLHAGRTPRAKVEGVTLREVLFAFLESKERLCQSGEITPRTFAEHRAVAALLVGAFGENRLVLDIASDDFDKLRAMLAKRYKSPTVLGNWIQRTRCVFRWAWDAGLIDKPVRFGPSFKRPSKKAARLHRANTPKRFIDAATIRAILDNAGPAMRAMVLLGVNCGLGNSDVAQLRRKHLDLKGRWLEFPRPKTGIARRSRLWPETVKALRAAMAERPTPVDRADDDLVFVTRRGKPWRDTRGGNSRPVSAEFRKLARAAGVPRQVGFYALRHVCRTVADEAKDQPAADRIMGHESPGMDSTYREHISDDRLTTVAEYLRKWLFGKRK